MPQIRIDTSTLTSTLFVIPGHSTDFIDGATAATINLPPGVHAYQPTSGVVASFRFEVTPDGLVIYDKAHEAFLDGRGTDTLVVRGFTVTLDARQLSHDLLPLLPAAQVLAADRVHQLTLVPAAGYGFQPASGIVADFRFDLTADGTIHIPAQYTDFTHATGTTLTIDGYRITIDARALSHDLLPLGMLGNTETLTRERSHTLTYIPAVGYGFQPASGIVADFRFDLTADGTIHIPAQYTGFAHTTGTTLTIDGYRITIDARALSHDLFIPLLGQHTVLARDRTHVLTLIPASSYWLGTVGATDIPIHFTVDTEGRLRPA
jgi:hypothetical protein